MRIKIVGTTFSRIIDPKIIQGSKVELYHDKDNKFSPNAIAVKSNDKILGYIGENPVDKHEEIFDALPITGKICNISKLAEGETFQEFETNMITQCSVEFSMLSDDKGLVQSFNEPNVSLRFDEKLHRYTYQGKEFLSATNYIKRWVKPFDKEMISGFTARSLGVKQEEVLGLWNDSGKLAADFGTVIHNALENYENYKEVGAIMQVKKDLEFNKALPSHPIVRDIVLDFYKQELQKGEVEVEALVTNVELGLCGYIDRLLILDRKKKICRVQDYKVNIGSEVINKNSKYLGQMAELPANKISKYQMQLSFYAKLLELSGWTVEGLDVFIYEDKWKHIPLEILDFKLK